MIPILKELSQTYDVRPILRSRNNLDDADDFNPLRQAGHHQSRVSTAGSGRSTPHVTVPDDEADGLVSTSWPNQI